MADDKDKAQSDAELDRIQSPSNQLSRDVDKQRGQSLPVITRNYENIRRDSKAKRLDNLANSPGMRPGLGQALAIRADEIRDSPRPIDSFKRGGTARKSGPYRLHKGERATGRSGRGR